MYYITKTFNVPVGHRLSKHKGKCKNFHGHNLKIEVTVSSKVLNEDDMVMDFSILKEIVNKEIISWDHGMFLNKNDSECKLLNECITNLFDSDPTAEVLCRYLYDKLTYALPFGVNIHSICIWEADDSKAEYNRLI